MVLNLDKPSEEFLCPLTANIYHIQFLNFRIRNLETKEVMFESTMD